MKASAAGLSFLALLGGAPRLDAFDYEIVDAGSIYLIDAKTGIAGTLLYGAIVESQSAAHRAM